MEKKNEKTGIKNKVDQAKTWFKDHKSGIKDVLIFAGGIAAIVALSRIPASDYDELDGTDEDTDSDSQN